MPGVMRIPWLRCGLVLAGLASAQDQDADLVQKARAIHDAIVTLDTHKDISPLLAPEKLPADPVTRERFRRMYDPSVWGDQQVDFPKMRKGGYDCAFFIVYVAQGRTDPAGYHRALREAKKKFEAIHRMARLFPEDIEIALSPDDVLRIARAGKLVACLGVENGYPMGEDLSRIREFWELGARYMSITHNGHNQLGDSHTPAEPLHGGLSELGARAIDEMNRVGIMVDVSHAAKSTMMQAVRRSRAPVIASHSACRALCNHSRNLDDEQLRAIARNGGVVQIVALAAFVKDATERRRAIAALRRRLGLPPRGMPADASVEEVRRLQASLAEGMKEIDLRYPRGSVADFVDHIDHAVAIMGIDHVGVASDFDGGGGVEGWDDASETFHVTLELVRRGYTREQIEKIWSGNTLRVWGEVERVAAELRAR